MKIRRQLHCVFYSNVLDIYKLNTVDLCKKGSHVLVELAVGSNLAPVFNRHHKREEGLLPLLHKNSSLHRLSRRLKNVSAPLILASNPSISAPVIISALGLIGAAKGSYTQATILVHINDAYQFINAYDYMDSFSIVWDIADYPTLALQKLAEILSENQYFDQKHWGGFHLVNHRNLPQPDDESREHSLRTVINEFSSLQTAD